MKERPTLIFEQDISGGEHIRIWRYEDGRFSLEHLKPTGKGTTIFCSTFEEAVELWCRREPKMMPPKPRMPRQENSNV